VNIYLIHPLNFTKFFPNKKGSKKHTLGVSKDHLIHLAAKLGQGQRPQRAPEVMVVR
jgi:hypothetical protein